MIGLTRDQIRWALSHDWALYPTLCGTGVICLDVTVVNGVTASHVVTHFDYAKLRRWAGY
jgi:hypothetical protein